LDIDSALQRLRNLPYEDIGFAKLDHHRALRRDFPEVVFGQGKTTEQITAIVEKLTASSDKVLVTRASAEAYTAVVKVVSDAIYNDVARTIFVDRSKNKGLSEGIMVLSAGTADLPVAEEAAITAELMGNVVDRAYDVGVAGIHRLFDQLSRLRKAKVIVVVAGMEGALPGVVSGLVSVPIVAVPTSCGYGTSFSGIAPLLTMLNSCSPGVSVVNIDNGFGAGYLASLINRGDNKK
jgi:NCAIR mutase (PurE)-related protein